MMSFDQSYNLTFTESTNNVNKFDIAWQIVRTRAKSIKDPIEKVNYVLNFLNINPNVHNYGRIMNWLKMTKVAYKDRNVQKFFDENIEYLTQNAYKYGSLYDNNLEIENVPLEDLKLVYNDLKKRKYGFQFKQVPKAHIAFLEKLEKELARRS